MFGSPVKFTCSRNATTSQCPSLKPGPRAPIAFVFSGHRPVAVRAPALHQRVLVPARALRVRVLAVVPLPHDVALAQPFKTLGRERLFDVVVSLFAVNRTW